MLPRKPLSTRHTNIYIYTIYIYIEWLQESLCQGRHWLCEESHWFGQGSHWLQDTLQDNPLCKLPRKPLCKRLQAIVQAFMEAIVQTLMRVNMEAIVEAFMKVNMEAITRHCARHCVGPLEGIVWGMVVGSNREAIVQTRSCSQRIEMSAVFGACGIMRAQ